MSLILDALRKLEREKDVPSRGFLVLAPGQRTAPRASWLLAVVILLALGGAGLGYLLRTAMRAPAPSPVPPAPAAVVPSSQATVIPPSQAPVVPPAPVATVPARPEVLPKPAPSPSEKPVEPKAAPSPVEFVLEAISERDGSPVAVLNDHLVKEGDQIDGALVVRIGKDEVELKVRGEKKIVRF